MTLPALNRMQPFTNLQLTQALCLARFLICNADSIPSGTPRSIEMTKAANPSFSELGKRSK